MAAVMRRGSQHVGRISVTCGDTTPRGAQPEVSRAPDRHKRSIADLRTSTPSPTDDTRDILMLARPTGAANAIFRRDGPHDREQRPARGGRAGAARPPGSRGAGHWIWSGCSARYLQTPAGSSCGRCERGARGVGARGGAGRRPGRGGRYRGRLGLGGRSRWRGRGRRRRRRSRNRRGSRRARRRTRRAGRRHPRGRAGSAGPRRAGRAGGGPGERGGGPGERGAGRAGGPGASGGAGQASGGAWPGEAARSSR